ncbi:MAG: DUF4411 family protein [Enhygromyxa sp.]
MAYSVDTSYFVRAWTVWYPYDDFEGVWRVLVSAAAHGSLFVVDRVRDELDRQVPELVDFFDKFAGNWHSVTVGDAALDGALKSLEKDLLAGTIIRSYPSSNIRKYISVADPALVLHAQLYGHVVVSNELSDKLTKKGPKIPDLCEVQGVSHATPAEFAGALGYKFGPV